MSPRLHTRPSNPRRQYKQTTIKKARGPYHKRGPSGRARLPYTKKTQPRKMSVTSSEDSDEAYAGMQGEAEMEDDNEDAEDESDVSAPSYGSRQNRKTGLKSNQIQTEDAKEPMMFDSEEEREAWFGDSEDDDEIYEAVDDISDDEDVNPPVEEEFLAAQFYDHPDVAANFLGELDGYSIFGFDNDDHNSFSSSSDSSDEVVIERRVHFESDVEKFPLNPESPEMTALTARTLPAPFSKEELRESSRSEELSAAHRAFLGDPDEDSDLTDEELPAEAHTASPSALQKELPFEDEENTMSPSPKDKKQANRKRGPPLGIFEFDGDKPWAVLDPSGTKVHIAPAPDTNRHDWLERKAQHAMNQILGIGSAESSPRGSFATLLDDSDRSVSSSQENVDGMIYGVGANVMMTGLNRINQHGYATGPPEAFYAPNGSHFTGDFLIDAESFDIDDDDRRDPTGEGRLNIEDFIVCGADSDDDDDHVDDDTIMSPTRLPNMEFSTPTHKKADSWSHLNSDNVLSFRRNADPSSASRHQPWNFDLPPTTPGQSFPSSPITRKRKARSPPYQGDHYRDVTVVERKLITPRAKRRRANTMH